MKVIVVANAEQQEEFTLKPTNGDADVTFVKSLQEIKTGHNFNALFYLTETDDNINKTNFDGKPVFINSVVETLEQKKLPSNFSRINGWPGFLKRRVWEVATNKKDMAGKIFSSLNWEIAFVKDEPGLVSARVIGMIINEAFFALEEGVSTKNEIDLAMKLGTNYPFGPFEWQDKIGIQHIYHLLKTLSASDIRYSVAPLLEKNYFEFISLQKK